MSIKSNKTQTIIKSRKGTNTKITFVFEDEYDWCFPDTVWSSVKDFLGIFDKVNRIINPFLLFIEKPFPKRNQDCWTDIQENEPDEEVAAAQYQYNVALNNKSGLRRDIRDRCRKDPTYARLQAYKFFQEKPPLKKGVVYPRHWILRYGTYDLEDMNDNSYLRYYPSGKYTSSQPRGTKTVQECVRAEEVADAIFAEWKQGQKIDEVTVV